MKNLVGMLMFDIYADAKTIFREYVQNAYDSINNAVEQGLLEPKDATILIGIDERERVITIKDNGTGICAAEAAQTLLSVAGSKKNGNDQAGQFGIGRLVGGGYCERLRFQTSARGENVKTVVEIDTAKAWQLVKEDPTDRLATEVFDLCTVCTEEQENEDEHYFDVTLIDVLAEKDPGLLDSQKVTDFLREVAPVEFGGPFMNGPLYKSTRASAELKEKFDGLKTVRLFVNNTQVKKPYGTRIDGSPKKGDERDEILHVEYFKIYDTDKNTKYGELGWGWYALTKFSTQIADTDTKRCLRLRKHNIQIGNRDTLNPLWSETRGNSYFYGEFFATHEKLTPNVERSGLVLNLETNRLKKLLEAQFKKMWTLVGKANYIKNRIRDVRRIANTDAPLSEEDRQKIALCLKEFGKLGKNSSDTPCLHLQEAYRSEYEEVMRPYSHLLAELANATIAPTPTQPDGDEEDETTANTSAAEPTNDEPQNNTGHEPPTHSPTPQRATNTEAGHGNGNTRPRRETATRQESPSSPAAHTATTSSPATTAGLSETEILEVVFGCIERFGLNWKSATQLKSFIRSKLDERRRNG